MPTRSYLAGPGAFAPFRSNVVSAPAGAAEISAAAVIRIGRSARDFLVIGTTTQNGDSPGVAHLPGGLASAGMQSQATLPGTGPYAGTLEIRHVIFRAEQDGYAVLEVLDPESGDEFTLVGPVGHLNEGERAAVEGEWQEHAKYGPQVKARGARPMDPTSREGQLAYLTTLRYIGPARAERLVAKHGAQVLEVIAAEPYRTFKALRGLSASQAEAATESWHASRAVRALHGQLAPRGLAHLAARLHR